MTKILIST